MEIRARITEACLYLRKRGSQGAEVTRLAVIDGGLAAGTHEIKIPTEQAILEVGLVNLVQTGGSTFKVLNIDCHNEFESFQDGLCRHGRGNVLFEEIKDCSRLRAEVRLALLRLNELHDQIKGVACASRLAHCGVHPQSYLEHLQALQGLGNEAYLQMETAKIISKEKLFETTARIQQLIAELRSMMENQRLGPCVDRVLECLVDDTQAVLTQYESILLGSAICGCKFSFKQIQRITKSHLVVTLELIEASESPISFLVKYPLREAGWTSSYEARIDKSNWSLLHVSYYADAYQASREDWVDTELTFTTAQIVEHNRPPSLPLYVVRPEEPKFAVKRKMMVKRAGPMMRMAGGMAAPMSASMFANEAPAPRLGAAPLEDESVMVASFKLSDKVSLASDQANTTQFLMGEFTLPMKSVLYCCPEVETGIYRVCRLENESPYYLVPSKACSVLIDGSLSATTAMKSVAPHEKFTLFLGDAEEAKMEVGPAKTWTKSGMGLVKQNDKGYYERSVTVTNHGDITCTILLVFNVVESQDSLVKITLDPSKIPSTTVIEAADDIALLDSSQFPALSTTQVDLKWIENPVTHNCIAALSLPSQMESVVTFATIMEIPNGRNVQIQALE